MHGVYLRAVRGFRDTRVSGAAGAERDVGERPRRVEDTGKRTLAHATFVVERGAVLTGTRDRADQTQAGRFWLG